MIWGCHWQKVPLGPVAAWDHAGIDLGQCSWFLVLFLKLHLEKSAVRRSTLFCTLSCLSNGQHILYRRSDFDLIFCKCSCCVAESGHLHRGCWSRLGILPGKGEEGGGGIVTSTDDIWTEPSRARDGIFLIKESNL